MMRSSGVGKGKYFATSRNLIMMPQEGMVIYNPGCRVLGAVNEGELSYLSHRRHKSADSLEKERWKEVALKIKAMKKRI
jgi:hypothetical protein